MRNKLTLTLSALGLGLALAALAMFESLDTLAKPPSKGGGGAKPQYEIIDLHPGGDYVRSAALGINDEGLMVGFAIAEDDAVDAIWWGVDSDGVTGGVLDPGPATVTAEAWAVNNYEEIAGIGRMEAEGTLEGRRGLFWASTAATPIVLEPPVGYIGCAAFAMSDDGVIVGTAYSYSGSSPYTAVVWRVRYDADGLPFVSDVVDLGEELQDSWGYDVNKAAGGVALVVGNADGGGDSRAVGWEITLNGNGTLTASAPIFLDVSQGGSFAFATAVNDLGEVCGTSSTGSELLGFVLSDGQLISLHGPRKSFFWRESVMDLNSVGEAIGSVDIGKGGGGSQETAVLWSGGSVYQLQDLLPGQTGFTNLPRASKINKDGHIVGEGWHEAGDGHAYLLVRLNPLN